MKKRKELPNPELFEDADLMGDCERELAGMDDDWGEPPKWLREVRENGNKLQGRVTR